MTRLEVDSQIRKIGIVPAVHIASVDDALFVAYELSQAKIPIIEIASAEPGALAAIAELARRDDGVIVGGGEVMDLQTARQCLHAGAKFITGPGFDGEVVELAHRGEVAVFPGALSPTEVLRAAQAGGDFVKVFPCVSVGGPRYIRALKAPFPEIPLIAAGGVHEETAADFIRAGASALGVGGALVPSDSIRMRQSHRIRNLARRFLAIVEATRKEMETLKSGVNP